MPREKLHSAAEAWDEAEKLMADYGIGWSLVRNGEHFHMQLDDQRVRVRIEHDAEHETFQYVINYRPVPGRLVLWRCSYPPVEALDELLLVLGFGSSVAEEANAARRALTGSADNLQRVLDAAPLDGSRDG